MQEYDVKRGLSKKTDLKALFEIHFGTVREEGGWLTGAFGAMPSIKAKYNGDQLVVDTVNDASLVQRIAKGDAEAMKTATETQRRWNDFLFDATGYDAKTRGKKAQEKAKKEAAPT